MPLLKPWKLVGHHRKVPLIVQHGYSQTLIQLLGSRETGTPREFRAAGPIGLKITDCSSSGQLWVAASMLEVDLLCPWSTFAFKGLRLANKLQTRTPCDRGESRQPIHASVTILHYPKYDDNVCSKLFLSQEQKIFRSCP